MAKRSGRISRSAAPKSKRAKVSKPSKSAAPRQAATQPKLKPKVGWLKFLAAYPSPYTALFMARASQLPSGLTLTKAVQQSLKTHAVEDWETLTVKQNGTTAVLVAFADRADFDRMKAVHNGKPWQSTIAGSVEGFSVTS